MRHFGSLLLAAIFGPAVFLLTGTGLSAFASARADTFIDDPLGTMAALGALLLAGVLYGILIMVRLSPVGPGLAGMLFMGASGFALVAPQSYDKTLGSLDVHMGGAVGQWGLGILLGVPLVATITSPRRWRREANPAASAAYAGYPPGHQPGYPQGYPAPTYPAQPQRQSIPDETKQMPKQPEYMTLPDIAPPSLRYPGVPPGAPPTPAPSTARPAASPPATKPAPPAPTTAGAPPPPPLSFSSPAAKPSAPPPASPGAPPPPPLTFSSAAATPPPPSLSPSRPAATPGAPPPPPLAAAKPSATPPSSGAPPRPPLSTATPAAAAPRLSDAAIPAETPPVPNRVPAQAADNDPTMKMSTEDEDRTRPLS